MKNNNKFKPEMLEHAHQVPFDPMARSFVNFGMYHPYEFGGWMDETMSWKENCYIHAGLSFMILTVDIKGPDVVKFMSDISTNSFNNFPVGSAKHVIMCNKNGNIMQHGMAVRISEDTIRTYDLAPYVQYVAAKGKYNVEAIDVTNERFVYQLAGPKSLEIVENSARQDIHDLRFMRFMSAEIAGHQVIILRMGMGGTISYEVHGTIEASHDVYNAIMEAGEPFNIQKLGSLAYCCNHTENGFAQSASHFPLAWMEDEDFIVWGSENIEPWYNFIFAQPKGTYSKDIHQYFRNPIELDWNHMVKFDHDFVGRKALEKIAVNPTKKVVTLRWNPEDVLDIYRSYMQPGEPYKFLVFPIDFYTSGLDGNSTQQDAVTKGGKVMGSSSWPQYTLYTRDWISLGVVDIEQAVTGNEVIVHWGEIGGKIKEVRATVSRFPYLDMPTNKDFDLESIPRYRSNS